MRKKRKHMGWIWLMLIVCVVVAFVWKENAKTFPVDYGISFSQFHAESLGLDWQRTYTAMLDELKPEFIRIAAMWNEVESIQDQYDFSRVDWMMDRAAEYNAKVVLVVGQKAPRWPECHVPDWLDYHEEEAEKHLLQYVGTVVNRYKEHAALEYWQVENEPFINFKFGECEKYNREAIHKEIEQVRFFDPGRKIIITDSGELSTWNEAINTGDIFGTTLYRIVRTPRGFTFSYDWLPAVFYRWKAQVQGKDIGEVFVSELQAEPWFTDATPLDTPTEESEKTMNPDRLVKHLDYVTHIGTPRAYLWGVEWWYFMKTERDDARYWDIVKERISE